MRRGCRRLALGRDTSGRGNAQRGVAGNEVIVVAAALTVHASAVNGQCVAAAGNDAAAYMVERTLHTGSGQNRGRSKRLIVGLQCAECHGNGICRQRCQLRQTRGSCERRAVDFKCGGVRRVNHQRALLIAVVIVERIDIYSVVTAGRVYGREATPHPNLLVVDRYDAGHQNRADGVRLGRQIDHVGGKQIEVERNAGDLTGVDLQVVLVVELHHQLQLAEGRAAGIHRHHGDAGAGTVVDHDGGILEIDGDLSGHVFAGRDLPDAEDFAQIDQLYEVDGRGLGKRLHQCAVGLLQLQHGSISWSSTWPIRGGGWALQGSPAAEARRGRGTHHGLRRAPCIHSLASQTRLTLITQTGS